MPSTRDLIDKVRQTRDDARAAAKAINDKAALEKRDLTPVELTEFETHRSTIEQADDRIAELEADERRESGATGGAIQFGEAASNVRFGNEARTYRPDGGPDGNVSYFGDILRRQLHNDSAAAERLMRHRAEVEKETRDLSRTDGAGGEFVPPAWLMSQYQDIARAPRVAANLMTNMPLPGGTDSLNIPKITTGVAVGIQTADNAGITETDMVSSSVSAPVRTIAGMQDVAQQLIDQSPAGFDQIVFQGLVADYERKLDAQLISGSGSSGQMQGILGLSGINAITYTDATPTIPELYGPLHQAAAAILAARELPMEAALTNGRWWAWASAQLDSNNRPLVVPASAGPANSFGASEMAGKNGHLGSIGTVPFHGTTGVPVNLGGGTNETRIILGRWSDSILFEGQPRTRVDLSVGSGTLTVRLVFYRYAAVAHRHAASYAVISSTGLVLASGY